MLGGEVPVATSRHDDPGWRSARGEQDADSGESQSSDGNGLLRRALMHRARARRSERAAASAEAGATILRAASSEAAVDGEPADRFAEATRGGGGAVPFQKEMERSFGQDLSGVTAHVGQKRALDGLGASAAARGDTIAFASSSPDREVVAHELTHVVQQRKGGGRGVHAKSEVGAVDSPLEREADAVAPRAAAGERVRVAEGGGGLQLKVQSASSFEAALKNEGKYKAGSSSMDGIVKLLKQLEQQLMMDKQRKGLLDQLRTELDGVKAKKQEKYQQALDTLSDEVDEEIAALEKKLAKKSPDAMRGHLAGQVADRPGTDEEGDYQTAEKLVGTAGGDAIGDYMQPGGSDDVNGALRQDEKQRQKKDKMTEKTFEQASNMMEALHKLPPCPDVKPLYRTTKLFPGGKKAEELQDKQIYSDPAFLSSSAWSKGTQSASDYMMRIESHRSGRDVSALGREENLADQEKEVLFYPGTQFEFLGKEGDGADAIYKFKEV